MQATYARRAHYGDGALAQATATCEKHKVAAPYTDEARGYAEPIESGETFDCVICPLPFSDLIGATVISYYDGPDRPVTYGGADEHGDGFSGLAFGIGSGRLAVRTCDPLHVAPADIEIPASDGRVTVEKLPRKRDYSDAGPWLLHYPGVDGNTKRGYRTKRDAIETGLRRMAIIDWHAQRAAIAGAA